MGGEPCATPIAHTRSRSRVAPGPRRGCTIATTRGRRACKLPCARLYFGNGSRGAKFCRVPIRRPAESGVRWNPSDWFAAEHHACFTLHRTRCCRFGGHELVDIANMRCRPRGGIGGDPGFRPASCRMGDSASPPPGAACGAGSRAGEASRRIRGDCGEPNRPSACWHDETGTVRTGLLSANFGFPANSNLSRPPCQTYPED
jgi:hypothetical protein